MRSISDKRLMIGARGFPPGLIAFGFTLLLAACATPEAPKPAAPSTPSLGWTAAIGLLDGGTPHQKCTAVLVAPNLIATAAHCFYPKGSTVALPPGAFVFHPNLGARPAIPEAHGTTMRAIGGVVPQGHISDFEAPYDWALLEIAPPVTAVKPVQVADFSVDRMLREVAGGDRLFVGGYGNGTNDALHIPSGCRILAADELNLKLDPRLIVTDCVFRIGDSGGPVALVDSAGQPLLIGIISGFGKHPTRSIPLGFGANAGSFAAMVQGPVISLLN
jgi:protease YdgD